MQHSNARLIAIDPSLRSSGWVLFDIQNESILDGGVLSAPNARNILANRFENLQTQVTELFRRLSLSIHDILVVEGPAHLVLNPSTAIKIEQVRGIFESVARSMGVVVPGRINPRTVQTELLGLKGKQLPREQIKAMAYQVATRLFGGALHTMINDNKPRKKEIICQDVIDASLIGALVIARIKYCQLTGSDLCESLSEGRGKDASSNKRMRGVRWKESDVRSCKCATRF